MQTESLSVHYLGMPTAVRHAKNGTFKYLRDRVWEKVRRWMEKLLSTATKEVLIKAVAHALPVYSVACLRLSRGLCESNINYPPILVERQARKQKTMLAFMGCDDSTKVLRRTLFS